MPMDNTLNPETGNEMSEMEEKRNGSTNPLSALAAGNVNSAKMAMTPQSKQGKGLGMHPWTSKGTQNPYQMQGTEVASAWNKAPEGNEAQTPGLVQPPTAGTGDQSGTQTPTAQPQAPSLTQPSIATTTAYSGAQSDLKSYLNYSQFQDTANQTQVDAAKAQIANAVTLKGVNPQIASYIQKDFTDLWNKTQAEKGAGDIGGAAGTELGKYQATGALTTAQLAGVSADYKVDANGKPTTDPAAVDTTKTTVSIMNAWSKANADLQSNPTSDDAKSRVDNINKSLMNVLTIPAGAGISINMDLAEHIFGDKSQAVGFFISNGMSGNITLTDSFLKDGLGIGTDMMDEFKQDIGKYLGAPVASTSIDPATGKVKTVYDLTGITYGGLQNQFASAEHKEYERASDLEKAMQDSATPMAERRAIQSELRSMGYTGTLASKASMDNLARDIGESDKEIVVGGNTYTDISHALDSTHIQSMVTNYLSGTMTDKEKAELPQDLRDLADTHREAFEAILSHFDADINRFNDNQQASKDFTAMGSSEDTLKTLGVNLRNEDGSLKVFNTNDVAAMNKVIAGSTTLSSLQESYKTGDMKTVSNINSLMDSTTATGKVGVDFLNSLNKADLKSLTDGSDAAKALQTKVVSGLQFSGAASTVAQNISANNGKYIDPTTGREGNALDVFKAVTGVSTDVSDADLTSALHAMASTFVPGTDTAMTLMINAINSGKDLGSLFAPGGAFSSLVNSSGVSQMAANGIAHATGEGTSSATATISDIKAALNKAIASASDGSLASIEKATKDPSSLSATDLNAIASTYSVNFKDSATVMDAAQRITSATMDVNGNPISGDASERNAANIAWNLMKGSTNSPLNALVTSRDSGISDVISGAKSVDAKSGVNLSTAYNDIADLAVKMGPGNVPADMANTVAQLSSKLFNLAGNSNATIHSYGDIDGPGNLSIVMYNTGARFTSKTVPKEYASAFRSDANGNMLLQGPVNQTYLNLIDSAIKYTAVSDPGAIINNANLFGIVNGYLNAYTSAINLSSGGSDTAGFAGSHYTFMYPNMGGSEASNTSVTTGGGTSQLRTGAYSTPSAPDAGSSTGYAPKGAVPGHEA